MASMIYAHEQVATHLGISQRVLHSEITCDIKNFQDSRICARNGQ